MGGIWARIGMMVIGLWLVVSAFAWPHIDSQIANTTIVGLAAMAIGAISLLAPRARFFNTAVAIWLFLSTFALPAGVPGSDAGGQTIWNNAICAVLLFALSLVPERTRHAGAFSHGRRVPVG